MLFPDKLKKSALWPNLQKAEEAGCLLFADLSFAKLLMEDMPDKNELTAAFLCHLSLSVRNGHLCVYKKEGVLLPSPESLWLADIPTGDLEGVLELLKRLTREDVKLPESVVTDVTESTKNQPVTPICLSNDRYYFQKYWIFEAGFSKTLQSILTQQPTLILNPADVKARLDKMLDASMLNEQQAGAIFNASQTCFSIICGGPGTGKTYTAGHLIRIFFQSLTAEQKELYEIALAAPTGKAANNLQKSLFNALSGVADFNGKITAKTLHSLLDLRNLRNFGSKPNKSLSADLVIVDESSMMDAKMIATLFDSIKTGARIILLGDPYQLPAVEAGSLFSDVIKMLKNRSGNYVSELQVCLRAELKEIISFSQKVKEGKASEILSLLEAPSENAAVSKIHILQEYSSKEILDFILDQAEQLIPKAKYELSEDPLTLLQSYNNFRMLSPLKNGLFGVQEINRLMHQRRLGKVFFEEYATAPIMITANDYKMDLFNGEVGVLVSRKERKNVSFGDGDFALFSGSASQPYRKIPAILLPKFELAYCLSVHKSQGSEFNHVILFLPQGSERFGREVLYTAITRAKRKLQIWGPNAIIEQTIYNRSERLSGLIPSEKIK